MARRPQFQTFARDLQMATEGLTPSGIRTELARFAKSELTKVIQSGEASPVYNRYVNGFYGLAEEYVNPPGDIFYEFVYWQPVLEYAIAFLEQRSPRLTGTYVKSHAVMVGAQIIRPDAQLGVDEEVMIVPTVPYSRKIEVGHMKMRVERAVFDDARRAVIRKFPGLIKARIEWITLPNGYVLKGRFRQGHRKHARTRIKPDTAAGNRMTYPALVMTMR